MNLKRLEAALRSLVESQLMRALPSRRPEERVIQRLLEAMSAGTRIDSSGQRIASGSYTIKVNGADMERWRDPQLLRSLAEALTESAQESGVRLATPPVIEVAEDPGAVPGECLIAATQRQSALKETQDVAVASPEPITAFEGSALPENAFLIVEGVREFALLEAVINIGRRLDNHLVIEDPRVSRHHAQLRAINGRFVLFDLDSSGGSFVNGQRLSQGILYPGDVISLAGVTLIYGQDTPLPQPPAGSTAPQPRAGSDRPTTIWRVSDPSGSALG